MAPAGDKVVAYYYDKDIGNYNFGQEKPMRPHRVRLTHSLVENYGLSKRMSVHRPPRCTARDLELFHADEYVEFLNAVTPENQDEYMHQMRRFNVGKVGEGDCPVFDCIFDYCTTYSGGSIGGATLINQGDADIVLNWAGGMHHAKKAETSGFCFINDIVLSILELLKNHQRVLYVDIDIHHGDGVEEAFYLTDRVMTVSFHKYGDFFPGTGALGDIGYMGGAGYSVNVPLQEGMDDESYRSVFEPIMRKVMEVFDPSVIVVCGGADSLAGDRLGCFNLSIQGHARCMAFLASFGIPMLVLGGGGYTMRNVARCWCYETGQLLGMELDDQLPARALEEFDYYNDTHRLRISVSNMKNANTRKSLEEITNTVLQNLSRLPPRPGAQLAVPPPQMDLNPKPEEELEERGGGQQLEESRAQQEHMYDSDDEDARACHSDASPDASEPLDAQRSASQGVPPRGTHRVSTGSATELLRDTSLQSPYNFRLRRGTRITNADDTVGSDDEDADMEDDDDAFRPATHPARNRRAKKGLARAHGGVSSLPTDGGLTRAGPSGPSKDLHIKQELSPSATQQPVSGEAQPSGSQQRSGVDRSIGSEGPRLGDWAAKDLASLMCIPLGYYKDPATGTFPASRHMQDFAATSIDAPEGGRCLYCSVAKRSGDKTCRKPDAPFCIFLNCETQLDAIKKQCEHLQLTPRQVQAVAYLMWRLEKPGAAADRDQASARHKASPAEQGSLPRQLLDLAKFMAAWLGRVDRDTIASVEDWFGAGDWATLRKFFEGEGF